MLVVYPKMDEIVPTHPLSPAGCWRTMKQSQEVAEALGEIGEHFLSICLSQKVDFFPRGCSLIFFSPIKGVEDQISLGNLCLKLKEEVKKKFF